MQGTEKQIKWAEDLKATHLKVLTNAIAQSTKHMNNEAVEDGDLELLVHLDSDISLRSALLLGFSALKPQPKECIVKLLNAIYKWLDKKDSASWWIKEGQFTTAYLVTQFAKTNIKAKKEV